MEELILSLSNLDPLLIASAVFLAAYLENLLPPLPSDLLVVFGGSLVAIGSAGFPLMLVAAAAGSTLGFMTMFKIGEWFGARILERGKMPFVPAEAVRRAEKWFGRYGYRLIVANRFLAGTRAVVSFFAGVSRLHLVRCAVLSGVSALVWNALLLGAGWALGRNWRTVGFYLGTYGQVVTGLLILTAVVWAVRVLARRKGGAAP
ncbi:MAG: DedA family protein [Bacteroidota bacterium]